MPAILRREDVLKKLSISKSQLYRLIERGVLPKPVKYTPDGYRVGWIESDLDAWISNLTPAE
jgi:predicted DNA-binding transcriptional regulator AlpA